MRRAALNPFFSKQKINSLEATLQAQIEKFCKRVEDFAYSGKILPLSYAYGAFTMDVVTEYAMEKSYGNLNREDFGADLVGSIKGIGPMWHFGKHFPWLLRHLLATAPSWLLERLVPKSSQWTAFQEVRDLLQYPGG